MDFDGKQLLYAAMTGTGLGLATGKRERPMTKEAETLEIVGFALALIGGTLLLKRTGDIVLEQSRTTFSDGTVVTLKQVADAGGEISFGPEGPFIPCPEGPFAPLRRAPLSSWW
jgi:hypothetical protein